MNENNGKYFFIPDWLLQESGQTIHAYIFILNEINNNGGELIITKKELAKTLNITERQVGTILNNMSDKCKINVRQMLKRGTSISIDFIGVTRDLKNNDVRQMLDKCQTNVRENKPKTSTKTFDFRTSLIEYGFKNNLVDDWLMVRKTKKATNTETAFKAFISEIESKECNINDMLQTSVTNSWSGFKHKWVDNLKKLSQSTTTEEKIGRTSIETIKKNAEYNGQY
jgi:hypothetical protein